MPTTEQEKPTSEAVEAPTAPAEERKRPGWLVPVLVVAAIAVIAGAVIAAVALTGDDATDPETVVTESIDAANARDIEAYGALLDPDIVVTYDLSPIGVTEEFPDDVGRESVLEGTQEIWVVADPVVTYEVIAVDGQTVMTSETATFNDGSYTRHTVTYLISEDGLIVREDHVIEE